MVVLRHRPAASGSSQLKRTQSVRRSENLPFSNKDEEGFENKIVDELPGFGKTVTYVWWAQRRGFIRNTLDAKLCDLVPGIPVNLERLRATKPYDRSAYVSVTRQDGPEIISPFDDPRLRQLRVGVQLTLATMAQTPRQWRPWPREASSANWWNSGLWRLFASDPPARIVEAVTARGCRRRRGLGPSGRLFRRKAAHEAESRQFRRLSTARNCR